MNNFHFRFPRMVL